MGVVPDVGDGVGVEVTPVVGVAPGVGVGVSADAGVGVGVGVSVGVEFDPPLNVILGLWLFGSVMVNPLAVSVTMSVTAPFTCDETVKFATPFCAESVYGRLLPLTFVFESPEESEILSASSTAVVFWKQSRMTACSVTDPVVVVMGGLGYTSEYHPLGAPADVVQFEFPELPVLPELPLVKVTAGL